MTAAFLILATVQANGFVQAITGIRYGSMAECAAALAQMRLRPTQPDVRIATGPVCTDTKPFWWVD